MNFPFQVKRSKIKPVHLATGIFVARLGGYHLLKRLNRVAMHQPKLQKTGPHKGRTHPDDPYTSDRIFKELSDSDLISDRVSREETELVRRALHQFVANDQAAFHCYSPHRPFGNDYSVCDKRLVTMDGSHPTDSGIGAIVVTALGSSAAGRVILERIDWILNQHSSLGEMAIPFLEQEELTVRPAFVGEVDELVSLMAPQTEALSNLATRLNGNFTVETQARLLILGLCMWVLLATLRWTEKASKSPTNRLLLADFSQRPRRPLRRASWLSVVQTRRQLTDYCSPLNKPSLGIPAPGNWAELFDYLGKRCGLIQPRSDNSRSRRYVEPMPDTIRVIVMSCFRKGETLLPFPKLAQRIREVWGIVIGAELDDPERIRDAGLGNLEEDEDIAVNVNSFRERLEELQLAVRLSDGEHRCAALPEDLP